MPSSRKRSRWRTMPSLDRPLPPLPGVRAAHLHRPRRHPRSRHLTPLPRRGAHRTARRRRAASASPRARRPAASRAYPDSGDVILEHPYAVYPAGWLLQLRPTNFPPKVVSAFIAASASRTRRSWSRSPRRGPRPPSASAGDRVGEDGRQLQRAGDGAGRPAEQHGQDPILLVLTCFTSAFSVKHISIKYYQIRLGRGDRRLRFRSGLIAS